MTVPQRFYAIIIAAALSLSAPTARAQGLQPAPQASSQNATQPGVPYGQQPGRPYGQQPGASYGQQPGASYGARVAAPTSAPANTTAPASTTTAKPSPGIPATTPRTTAPSLLDEPATPAQIQLTGDQLSITAANASLSQVIRQVAATTGMQVEGNSRDERIFGSWGPASPPEVLSALLYDTGYNVMMVGATADGAPRRLVLSPRNAGSTAPSTTTPTRVSDDDDDETPVEQPPPPQANPLPPAASSAPPAPGQPKTPQQMLEELQRMHQGQQPPDLPHDPN